MTELTEKWGKNALNLRDNEKLRRMQMQSYKSFKI